MNNATKFEKSKLPSTETSMQTAPITGAGITATFSPPTRTPSVPQANPPEAGASAANTWPQRPAGPPQQLMKPSTDTQAGPVVPRTDVAGHVHQTDAQDNMEDASAVKEEVDEALHPDGEAPSPGLSGAGATPVGGDDAVAADPSDHADENVAPPKPDEGAADAGTLAQAPADDPAAPLRASSDTALDPVILGQAPEIKPDLDRVPHAVAEFTRCVAESLNVSQSFVFASLLSSMAVAIGMSRTGRAGPEWKIRPIIWVMNNADSTSGKTPAMDRAMQPFDTVVGEIVGQTRARTKPAPDAGLRARVAQMARDMEMPLPAADTVEVESVRPFMCHAVTLPGIEKVAVGNPRQVMIRRDEGIPLLKTKDPELRAALLSAYDGAPYRRTTGKGDVDLPHFGLWIIVGAQPDKLAPLLESLADDGLGGRFLTVVGSAVPLEQMGAQVDDGPMEDILRWLFALKMDDGPFGPVPREIPFSPEAQALIFRRRQTARAQADHEVGVMAGVMGKSAGTVARLALILGLVRAAAQTQEEPEAIEAQDVHDAAALFDEFFAPMARAAYGLQSCTPVEQAARKLVQALKAAGRKTISVRDLQRMATTGFNKGDDFLELLVWLEARNVLMWLGAEPSGPQGGAPSPRYAVHPQIWQWDWAPKV